MVPSSQIEMCQYDAKNLSVDPTERQKCFQWEIRITKTRYSRLAVRYSGFPDTRKLLKECLLQVIPSSLINNTNL